MFRSFSRGFFNNLAACFRGYNLVWHAVAILLTLVLVLSGLDWWFFEHTRNPLFYWLIIAAGIGGFFVPVVLPVVLHIAGEIRARERVRIAAAAVAQSVIIAWFISSFYKIFTGRTQPEFLTHASTVDISRDFHFGILQHGIFWGWPSSHAAVAVALAATLWMLYPNNKIVRYIALLYAVVIAVGAAIGFHWFSDVVAGVIFGVMIGITVARNFANH